MTGDWRLEPLDSAFHEPRGNGAQGARLDAEIFDPALQTFQVIAIPHPAASPAHGDPPHRRAPADRGIDGELVSDADVRDVDAETSDGTRTYTWNARNELTGLSGPVGGTFGYDAIGRRRTKTVSGTTTEFLYDRLNPVQELASGTATANVLTGLGIDEYFRRTDASTTRYYSTDALGSAIALTDGAGSVQTSYTYEPFGALSSSGASTTNTFGYTGREADGTGLFYYRARYYDPRLQRFTSEDPLGFEGGVNVHGYVQNNPTRYRDPMGLLTVIAGVGASVVVPPIGVEVSGGIAINPGIGGCAGIGGFASGGIGTGLNVGGDAFFGFVLGGFNNVAGNTGNVNITIVKISITGFFDPSSGRFVGGTIGVGPSVLPIQASGTAATTGTFGYAPGCEPPSDNNPEPPDNSQGGSSSGPAGSSSSRLAGRKQ